MTSSEKESPEGRRDEPIDLGLLCPGCGEPWLRPTQLPGRFRCVNCLVRFKLMSHCPSCGEHSTIVRMRETEVMLCVQCGRSMLRPV